jgi:hypothetical protein
MSHNEVTTTSPDSASELPVGPGTRVRERIVAARSAVSAAIGSLLAVVPHVLHHVGILAGAAFITGAAGNLLFGAVGLVLSIPLLRRLYRRFATWKAPAIAIVVFAAMFSLSAFVIGPAISGGSSDAPTPTNTPVDHSDHHG